MTDEEGHVSAWLCNKHYAQGDDCCPVCLIEKMTRDINAEVITARVEALERSLEMSWKRLSLLDQRTSQDGERGDLLQVRIKMLESISSSQQQRIVALEARVAVAEKRLTALEIEPSDPDEAMPSGCFDCDSTTCRCADPEPVPQWRVSVDSWAESGVMGEAEDPLAAVLWLLHRVSLLQGVDHSEVADALARIVAVAEGQVGDGWKADPGRVPHGHWGIAWLLAPLSHEPPDWVVVADRAAAWLRSLLDSAS